MIGSLISKTLSLFENHLLENVNKTSHSKHCLLAYLRGPFLPQIRSRFAHQSHEQVRELAKILGELGYNVDVMNYSAKPKLGKFYDLVIDIHPDSSKPYWKHLKKEAKKIIYFTGSYPDFQNQAEQKRLQDLQKRRGVKLRARRQVPSIPKSIWERFDAILLMGNEQTKKTFPKLKTPIYLITNAGDENYPKLPKTQKSAKSFLFLASGGQVHKGLDLLLEIFARHPELELYVCSPFAKEEDFTKEYYKELYETPNIHPIGFLDPYSQRFQEIAKKCAYLLSPSCSEGMSGSVLVAMSAGIIPIASKACGVDKIKVFEESQITKDLKTLSKKSSLEVSRKAYQMTTLIQERYSKRIYSIVLQRTLRGLLN